MAVHRTPIRKESLGYWSAVSIGIGGMVGISFLIEFIYRRSTGRTIKSSFKGVQKPE